jgi:ribosomal protein L32
MVYLIAGKEVCPTTGTPHLQGYVVLKQDQRMSAMKKLNPRAHWKIADGSTEQNFVYCSKDGDYKEVGTKPLADKARARIAGEANKRRFDDYRQSVISGASKIELAELYGDITAKYPRYADHLRMIYAGSDCVKIDNPHAWQKAIMDIVDGPVHDRKVMWVVDREGGKGKTHLAKHFVSQKGAIYFTGGKVSDCLYAWLGQSPVIFDFSRDQSERIQYGLIEQIKNGLVFSHKFESQMKSFKAPHVVCFSNFMPDQSKLSADRWHIMDLDESPEFKSSTGLHKSTRGFFDSRTYKQDEFSEDK